MAGRTRRECEREDGCAGKRAGWPTTICLFLSGDLQKLKSTTHRVIQDKESESKPRYSIPFFLHPAPSINLKSIYRDDDKGILADDFLNQRLKEIKLY